MLAQAALDMADWWEASSDTHLSCATKSLICEVLAEAGGLDASREVVTMKKADAVALAQAALAGKRWLPKLLWAEA